MILFGGERGLTSRFRLESHLEDMDYPRRGGTFLFLCGREKEVYNTESLGTCHLSCL